MVAEHPKHSYTVKLPQFEGPLDLLLSLAQQGQVDLREVPLAQIAEDYLATTRTSVDLEEATEVLWVLATLVELKSRLLVPKPPPLEEIPPEEGASDLQERLEAQLGEYRAFKEVAGALRALEDVQHRVFARPEGASSEEVLLEGVSLEDLFRAFRHVLERAQEEVGEVFAEEVKVADQMQVIIDLLAAHPDGVLFPVLFASGRSTLQIIVTFLALLELIKERRVRALQSQPFAAIRLTLVSSL